MEWNTTCVEIVTAVSDTFWTAAGLNGGSISPDAVWGFNICPMRVINLSEFPQWAPTYGDSQRPNAIGCLVFGR